MSSITKSSDQQCSSSDAVASSGAAQLRANILHGTIAVLVFVAVMVIAVVGVVTDASTATGEEPRRAEAAAATDADVDVAVGPDEVAAAIADIAAVIGALPTTTTVPAPARVIPVAAPVTRPAVSESDPGVWDALAQCETGGNWATASVPGFSGGLGFHHGTWTAMGGGEFAPIAADATREQQIEIARRVLDSSGWGAWPGCSDLLGLR